jgi:hypothetical protein
MAFDKSQIYDLAEPEPLRVPSSTAQALAGLGQTVLTAIDGAIAAAIASATQQLALVMVSALEKSLNVAAIRATLASAKASFGVIDSYKQIISPYMPYLDIVPEVKKPLVQALSFTDNVQAELKSTIMKLERLTYMNDIANGLAGELSTFISELLSVRKLIANIIAQNNP